MWHAGCSVLCILQCLILILFNTATQHVRSRDFFHCKCIFVSNYKTRNTLAHMSRQIKLFCVVTGLEFYHKTTDGIHYMVFMSSTPATAVLWRLTTADKHTFICMRIRWQTPVWHSTFIRKLLRWYQHVWLYSLLDFVLIYV